MAEFFRNVLEGARIHYWMALGFTLFFAAAVSL